MAVYDTSQINRPVNAVVNEHRGERRFTCGPLDVRIFATEPAVHAKVVDVLSLYNVAWERERLTSRVDVALEPARVRGRLAAGNYLSCARMRVDQTPEGLYASTESGATATCVYTDGGAHWEMEVPERRLSPLDLIDIEDLTGLALTTGWRRLGFVPIHAAAVVSDDGRCAIICATSGGGKSTFTASLIRNGWKALGDDKILLKCDENGPFVMALVHAFNLHPQTQEWFPEVGDLNSLPKYSAWSEKRRVFIDTVWPGSGAFGARPTHIVQLDRKEDASEMSIVHLPKAEALPTLLRQTVLPTHPELSRHILATVATTARNLTPVRVEVGNHAYRLPSVVTFFSEHLR